MLRHTHRKNKNMSDEFVAPGVVEQIYNLAAEAFVAKVESGELDNDAPFERHVVLGIASDTVVEEARKRNLTPEQTIYVQAEVHERFEFVMALTQLRAMLGI
jgi:hypothetical protein